VVVFAVIPLIDVETLATWVVTLVAEVVAIVRAAGEAVVTCGHEVSHGTWITEPGEIPTEVGVVLFCNTQFVRDHIKGEKLSPLCICVYCIYLSSHVNSIFKDK
jgi:hypothetical protein